MNDEKDVNSLELEKKMRLAKRLAASGLCSRREGEGWILAGRIKVNGELVKTPAFNVTLQDEIKLDGKPINDPQKGKLWIYYKPRGLVVTRQDERGRKTIYDELPSYMQSIMSVGRLDIESEGLLLLTHDGDLARRLEHPSQGYIRRYMVRVYGEIPNDLPERLKNGIEIEGIRYKPITMRYYHEGKGLDKHKHRNQIRNQWLDLELTEGKNREIRNIMTHFHLQTSRLVRIGYGPYSLGTLKPGMVKEIS